MRHLFKLPTYLLLFFISSCTTPKHYFQYQGPPLQRFEEAIVKIDNTQGPIYVHSVNGEIMFGEKTTWSGSNSVEVIHLTPGVHTISGIARTSHSSGYFSSAFKVEAGKKYNVRLKVVGYRKEVEVFEVEY
jgi:hypothetical protein